MTGTEEKMPGAPNADRIAGGPLSYCVRPFKDEDEEQVKNLYWFETGYSPTSMHAIIMRSSLTRPNSIVCYILFTISVALILALENLRAAQRVAVMVVSVASAAFFVVHRWQLCVVSRSFTNAITREPDFQGISKWYGISRRGDGSTYLVGKSGFWVAELLDPGSKIGTGTIVGCVGLDASFHEGTTRSTAQLRRMIVSSTVQRKGVGRRLIQTLLDHARERKIGVVELQTNGHCPPAVAIYESLGWKAFSTQGAAGKPWVDIWAVDYRLEL